MVRLFSRLGSALQSLTLACPLAALMTLVLCLSGCGGSTPKNQSGSSGSTADVVTANAGGPYVGSVGLAIKFDGSKSSSSKGEALTYAWDFGDGTTATGVAPSHTYTAAGTYAVTLTATDTENQTGRSSGIANIALAAPVAKAGGPYTTNAGTAVSFDGSGSTAAPGQVLTYAWDFGDGTSGTGSSTTHVYAAPGSFTAKLTVTAGDGRTASAVAAVTVFALPAASVGGPYRGIPAAAIQFRGSQSTAPAGQALRYAWTFGDGATASIADPSHAYASAGTYSVSLTVTGDSGGVATASTTATVSAVPVANAGGPYVGTVNNSIPFDATGSTVSDGQPLSFAWDFGDGSTATGAAPAHAYTAAGTYMAKLTVSASGGGTSTATAMVSVTAGGVHAEAGGPYTGSVGTAITFDASKSTGPAGQSLTYLWDFGDNTTASGAQPTHAYAAAGTFKAAVTVATPTGVTANASAMVVISAGPVANVGGPYTGTVGVPLTLDGTKSSTTQGEVLTYAWTFGDGASASGASPSHTYTVAGTYTASLTVTSSGGGTATGSAVVTISSLPVANAGGPYTGAAGAAISFDASRSTVSPGQTLTYAWDFGDGATGSGATVSHLYTSAGTYTAKLTVTSSSSLTSQSTAQVTIIAAAQPAITGISPASGPVGTLVTVTGTNLQATGAATMVSLAKQGGGTIAAPISSSSATAIIFVIPAGAGTGQVTLSVAGKSVAAATPLTVSTSGTYALSILPASASVIQGQSTSYSVSVSSADGFPGVASLSVSGLPAGVTATFAPASIGVGQLSLLTIKAPTGQSAGTSQLTLTATASADGQPVTQTGTASLEVKAVTTTFLGRTVVSDATETPIAGVTVKFAGSDGSGRATGCSGQTVSDGSGNFTLTNLPAACTGPQLIAYDGLTATKPAGKFAGVNLSYTLVAGQVVASPVLVHLPRLDSAETVQVAQNSPVDQVFYFHSIPGVKVTVYAGTTIKLADGSQPDPFPLVAISIPLDRLPEQMPTTGMLMPFIVAFQPANAVASQPVAVNFPNSLGVAPNTHVTFVTLDPTRGYMVPYGTGTVSNDGSQFVADADPNHTGHAYGIVHFDWHGPATQPKNDKNPPPGCGGCPSKETAGEPVDIASGLVEYTITDVQIGGRRGGLNISRTYRTEASNAGPFGRGTGFNYGYQLDVTPLQQGLGLVDLVMPDGNQYVMNQLTDGTFTNNSIPLLRGAVLSGSVASGSFTLRWVDGSAWGFQLFASLGSRAGYLSSMTDANGNQTTLTLSSSQPNQVTQITDPVGRHLTLTYDSSSRITQIADPIGRKVGYTYNSSGTLASVTDQAGGVTKYTYTSGNNLASIVDPRGVTTEQNTYNEAFDGRVTQQVLADGGTFKFTYTLQNPKLATSPVLQTVVTDPRGQQTTYRFDMQGFLQSVTDASGQTRELTHDPNHYNLVSDYVGNGTCQTCGNPGRGDMHKTYDQYGNTTSMTDALGNKTSMTYDSRFSKVASVTDASGNKTTITYDSNGNPTSVTDANGHTTKTVYDAFGEPIQTTDATGAKTTIKYDSFGNVSSVTNALGNITSFTYDGAGRLTQVQDALGRHGQTAYDALDRVTKVTDPLNNATQLAYDAVGDLLSLTDPKGNATSFVYDSRQRLSTRTDPLKRAQSYAYDVNSNLTQFTDRRGQVSKFDYDTVDRLKTATYQDSTVTNTYDAAGRLLNVSDSMDGQFGYKYDVAGRLLQQSMPTGVVQYTRDALGRIVTKQVVGQPAASYTYDAVGNVLTAALPNAGVTFTYDSRDLPLTLSRTNGVVSTYSFDSIGELLTLVHAKGATVLNSQAYGYDTVGKRIAVTNDLAQPLTTQSATYTVDANNQLVTGTTAAGTTQYTFDANGNRQTETSPAGKVTYTWDARNRLSSITNADGSSVAMHYDSVRNLLELDRSTGTTTAIQRFVVDELTNVISINDSTGSSSAVLGAGNLDSYLASVTASGNTAFGLGDAIGSYSVTTDASGQTQQKASYEPFGFTLGSLNSAFPFGFTGRLLANAGIYYNRDRYLDTSAGTFLSEDPLGISENGSLYQYADDDPISLTDQTGDFGLPGAVVSGVLNAATQFAVLDYKYHGDWRRAARCINFTKVAVAAAFGFVLPGFGDVVKTGYAAVTGAGAGTTFGASLVLWAGIGIPYKQLIDWELPPLTIGDDCECQSPSKTSVSGTIY